MSGELPAGVQLPGHRDLASMYSVSVGSVREAISMLISSAHGRFWLKPSDIMKVLEIDGSG